MATAEEKKEKKAKKGPGLIERLFSWPSKITAAGWAAFATAVFLFALIFIVWFVFLLDPNNVPWRHSMSRTRILLELGLAVVIPIVIYWTVRWWTTGEQSPFPDIDFAWKNGIEALEQSGISLKNSPLFVILGSAGDRQERALTHAAGLSLRVAHAPDGPAALHWCAGPDGVYLFCSEVGWTSAVATLAEKNRAGRGNRDSTSPGFTSLRGPARSAAPAPAPAAPAQARRGSEDATKGTILLDQYVAEVQSQAAARETPATPITAERDDAPEETETPLNAAAEQPALLPARDSQRQSARLDYLCFLLRQARFPLTPVNGVLTLLPFDLLQSTPQETAELQKAVRADMSVMQRTLQVRCPVTALVSGMQNERGFRELVRRVGRERAASQRFGKRFDLQITAGNEQITALCSHLGGVFEDWIHTLFREAEALTRPGNPRLYALLCKMRGTIAGVLRDVLSGGFAFEKDQRDLPEPVAFSGCYFAATGEGEDQQAFVRGVFEKLGEEQEELEWTRAATNSNKRYVALAVLGSVASIAAVLVITVALIVRWTA